MNDSLGQSGCRRQELDSGHRRERGLACTSSPDVLLQDILSMLSEKTKSLSLATIYLCVKSALITIVLLTDIASETLIHGGVPAEAW